MAVAALLGLFTVRVELEAQGAIMVLAAAALLVDLLGVQAVSKAIIVAAVLELAERVLPILKALAAGVAVALLTRQPVVMV